MIQKALHFIQRDMWRIPGKSLTGVRGFFVHILRIVTLSLREFASAQCALRASALTFYSLLSIVPVFAMAFGIAKGFGVEELLREKIMENMQGQQEVMTRVLEFSENLLANTQGGVIAGIGLALLFWTVIQVLSNIEKAFNHIWGIKKARTLGQKFSDYLAFMLVAPIFFILASSTMVFIASQIELITEKIAVLGMIGIAPLIFLILKLLPFVVFAGLLTYVYIFMPNGKISFQAALLGGVVAGAIYNIVQWAYIHFQIGASNAGAVYGTFAALPLFLAWLQTSWLIVLYGAELAFAHQNETKYEYEQDCLDASEELKKLLSLRIAELCVSRFVRGLKPLSVEEIAAALGMPVRLARDLLDRLTRVNLLTRIAESADEREYRYQPGRDVGEMTVAFVIDQMEKAGSEEIPISESPQLERLRESLRAFDEAVHSLPQNILLKDLSKTPTKYALSLTKGE